MRIRSLVFAICWCTAELILCRPGHSEEHLKIGVIVPLSGEGVFWGGNTRDGVLLALEDLKAGKREDRFSLEPIFENDFCDPKTAVSAYRKLTAVDKARFIIGPVCSSSTLAVAPLAEHDHILLIAPCSEAAAISQAGDFVFRTWTPGGSQGAVMAAYARKTLGLTKAATAAVQNDYGLSLSKAFENKFRKLGGVIVASEEYLSEVTDLRPQLLRIKSKVPEAIYFAAYPRDAILGIKQARQLKINVEILGSSNMASNEFISNAGALAEGIFVSDLSESTASAYQERFSRRFHRPWPGLTSCASVAYDALQLLADGIRKVGPDPVKIKDYLYSIKDFPGASGPITFDANGDLTRKHRVFRIRKGKLEPAD